MVLWFLFYTYKVSYGNGSVLLFGTSQPDQGWVWAFIYSSSEHYMIVVSWSGVQKDVDSMKKRFESTNNVQIYGASLLGVEALRFNHAWTSDLQQKVKDLWRSTWTNN